MDSNILAKQMQKGSPGILIISIFIVGVVLYYFGVFSPRGVIVADRGDDSSTKLGEFSYRITASIQNDGKSGEITLTAGLTQGGNYWKKSLTKYIEKDHVEIYIIEFDEAELLGGDASYTLSCSP